MAAPDQFEVPSPVTPPLRPVTQTKWMDFDDALRFVSHARRFSYSQPERGWHVMGSMEAFLFLAECETRNVYLGREQTMQFKLHIVEGWVAARQVAE